MSAANRPRRDLRTTVSLHIGGDVMSRVQPLTEWDRVVVHLDHTVSLHFDRDGLALLGKALDQARAELDAAQDQWAADIEATLTDPTTGTAGGGVERLSA